MLALNAKLIISFDVIFIQMRCLSFALRGLLGEKMASYVNTSHSLYTEQGSMKKLEQCQRAIKKNHHRAKFIQKALFHVINFIEAGLANYEFHFSLFCSAVLRGVMFWYILTVPVTFLDRIDCEHVIEGEELWSTLRLWHCTTPRGLPGFFLWFSFFMLQMRFVTKMLKKKNVWHGKHYGSPSGSIHKLCHFWNFLCCAILFHVSCVKSQKSKDFYSS